MPDENPYRYDGTAESLAMPSEPARGGRPPSGNAMFFAGLLAALAAALFVPLFSDALLIPFSLSLTPFVLLPIGIFIGVMARKRNPFKAQLGFWLAAVPLGLYFVALLFDHGSDAGVVQQIGRYLLIGYGSQLLAASSALFFMTRTK